ncbi:MAG: phosphoglucosamine mutase [Candidatus Neomarinimicrobiota bacterium]|nr:phosphoglucosamine mutase [Candidatus Neomarinimicrobiota bacterium]|tara:strand:+ start:1147 stop:2490 length:1344 start_codon:yes stop_codon:yes gene_type:complete
MKLIQGISGVRGIVGKTLTQKILSDHIQAFSNIQKNGDILLARDSRIHGQDLIKIASETLIKCGRNVFNYNIIPTPTAQFLVEKNKFAGGIVITASHNPEEWNGLKFIDYNGCFLNEEKNEALFKKINNISNEIKTQGKIIAIKDGYLSHVEHTLKLSMINLLAIKNKKFTVVIDAVNGAASKALPKMLKALGCKVYSLHCNPNGVFPRGCEPLPHNLNDLKNAVIDNKADMGFATDPDGDRLAIIDEKGIPLGEEYTLVFCIDGFLKSTQSNKDIVTNLSTTLAVDRIAKKYGNNVIRTAVGEINVVNKMKEINSMLGGEGNGGVILTESHLGRDSLIGVTLFLNRMAQTNKSVSQVFQSMPQYIMLKDKIELNNINAEIAINKIQKAFPKAKQNHLDGLKLIWNDSWLHIRKSNTEPIIRIYAEAPTKSEVLNLINKVKSILQTK